MFFSTMGSLSERYCVYHEIKKSTEPPTDEQFSRKMVLQIPEPREGNIINYD